MRSFNNSLLNEHIESITFSEFNNEEEGKVKNEGDGWIVCPFCMLRSATHTHIKRVSPKLVSGEIGYSWQ
jgi:hypothetical protein